MLVFLLHLFLCSATEDLIRSYTLKAHDHITPSLLWPLSYLANQIKCSHYRMHTKHTAIALRVSNYP